MAVVVMLTGAVQAQSETVWRWSGFGVGTGLHYSKPSYSPSITEWKQALPESALLQRNFEGFTHSISNTTYGNSGFYWNTSFYRQNKKSGEFDGKRELRFGMNLYSLQSNASFFYRNDRTRLDTLSNGEYLDSVTYKGLQLYNEAQYLNFDAALIFRSPGESRFRLYAGAGLQMGMSLNNRSELLYREGGSYEISYGNISRRSESEESRFEREQWKQAVSISASVYMPLGVEWQMGKRREFFRPLFLTAELRPMMQVTGSDDFGAEVSSALTGMMGVRYRFMN